MLNNFVDPRALPLDSIGRFGHYGGAGRDVLILGAVARRGNLCRVSGLSFEPDPKLDVASRTVLRPGGVVLSARCARCDKAQGGDMSLLQVKAVSKHFGSLVAVNNISMTVEPGELRAIIGPNGAGKTTFFNLITGFFSPTAGRIIFDGQDVTDLLPARRVWCGMARTFQVTEVFPELTVWENLRIAVEVASGLRLRAWLARADDKKIRARVRELIDMGGLAAKAGRQVGELSHGDQRATEIMMALALKPRLLLLDEPTAGMGDQETYEITQLIHRLHKDGKLTIVLIEHDMRVVFHLADRIM
ncbi:MAG TPA: ABC transporter ATP-binding protein, partial [Xanthobacteraceae bacterium]